jgi:hypothetical protein
MNILSVQNITDSSISEVPEQKRRKRVNRQCKARYNFSRIYIPSNAYILTLIFRKTVVFSKICLGTSLSKFLEVCINSEYMWYWIPVYNFNSARALKKLLSASVEVTATLPNSDHRRIYLWKSFHSDMPNFDTALLNKQNWCKSKYDIWVLQHKIPQW